MVIMVRKAGTASCTFSHRIFRMLMICGGRGGEEVCVCGGWVAH